MGGQRIPVSLASAGKLVVSTAMLLGDDVRRVIVGRIVLRRNVGFASAAPLLHGEWFATKSNCTQILPLRQGRELAVKVVYLDSIDR